MNRHGLNAVALNALAGDALLRVSVRAVCAAVGRAGASVLHRAPAQALLCARPRCLGRMARTVRVHEHARAQVTAALKALARAPAVLQAQAVLALPLAAGRARMYVVGRARAIARVGALYGAPVRAVCCSGGSIRPTLAVRSPALLRARAAAVAQAHALRGLTARCLGYAAATGQPRALRLRLACTCGAHVGAMWWVLARAPAELAGRANAHGVVRGARRAQVAVTGAAQGIAHGHAMRGGALVLRAQALVEAQLETIKRVRYDEPAVDEQTFWVAFENNVFVVG